MDLIKPREGDIYSEIEIGGHKFTIRYGYYSKSERGMTEPIPVYPCFISTPHYTPEGLPLITRIQDACEYYRTQTEDAGDGWCADCIHCDSIQDEIGICQCKHRRKPLAAELPQGLAISY